MSFNPKQLQQQMMQALQQAQQMQDELQNEVAEPGTAGGGMVAVTATGGMVVKEVKIAKEAIDPDDPELLEDMVLAATNAALENARGLAQQKLGGMMGGLGNLGLPGL
jgi:nucleoid-associated protein EbfC